MLIIPQATCLFSGIRNYRTRKIQGKLLLIEHYLYVIRVFDRFLVLNLKIQRSQINFFVGILLKDLNQVAQRGNIQKWLIALHIHHHIYFPIGNGFGNSIAARFVWVDTHNCFSSLGGNFLKNEFRVGYYKYLVKQLRLYRSLIGALNDCFAAQILH